MLWVNSKDLLPNLLKENDWSDYASVPVLGVVYGQIRVVKLEQWDEDAPAQWYSDCSEHWNLGNSVTHWQPLPSLPDEE